MIAEPSELWLVRHGQSLGNVARDAAHETDAEVLDLVERDMDVPLSDLGREQAQSFGRWLAEQRAPDVVLASPYVRAQQTAALAIEAAGLDLRVHTDERLRERELGILDLLTTKGVRARYPVEAERRSRLGKFYHRPPGGESWVDVALRLRSLRDSLAREHGGKRVLIVTHEVVITLWRYLIEDLDEARVLKLNGERPLANCSLTRYVADPEGRLELDLENWTVPLESEAVPVTEEHDVHVGPS